MLLFWITSNFARMLLAPVFSPTLPAASWRKFAAM
jgi:hypothetical protein